MSTGGRFGRIARDLEKLPCELIEPVLEDLEFEQVIRISQFGGPRVAWAVENSPTWSHYFRTNRIALHDLLTLTDEIIALCYQPGTFKFRPVFWRFWFLNSTVTNIRSRPAAVNFPSLARTWTVGLCVILSDTMGDIFKNDFLSYVRFLSRSSDLPDGCTLEEIDSFVETAAVIFYVERTVSSPIPEAATLARWVALYKKIRDTRISMEAAELLRLAELHEKHASRVKKPWAPQTRRPNTTHIVDSLRREAAKLEKGRRLWHGNEPSKYRFTHAFAALVPYDWCLRLLCLVLERHALPAEGEEGGAYPKEMAEMVSKVLHGLPSFYDAGGKKMLDPMRVETLRTANTPWSTPPHMEALLMADMPLFAKLKGEALRAANVPWSVPPKMDEKESTFLTVKERKRPVFPHSETELSWLEAFVEVVAWMEERFPSLVDEVRGEEWDKGDDIEAAIKRRGDKKRRKLEMKLHKEKKATNSEDFGLKQSLCL